MTQSAPRIAWILVEAIPALDEPGLPIADLWRRLCTRATELGLPQPSYQQTRLLAHRARRIQALPGIGDLAVDVMLRTRGPAEALDVGTERLLARNAEHAALERERSWRPPSTSSAAKRAKPEGRTDS